MPRYKKRIKFHLHLPLPECRMEFIQKTNQIYVDSVRENLRQMRLGEKEKGDILLKLIES